MKYELLNITDVMIEDCTGYSESKIKGSRKFYGRTILVHALSVGAI